jgi:hypothetical protein
MSDPKESTDPSVPVEPPVLEAQNSEIRPVEMEKSPNKEVSPTPAPDDLEENATPLADQIDDLQICSQSSQSDAEMQSGPETAVPEFQEPRAPPARKALNPFAVVAARKTSSLGLLSQYADTDSDSSSSSDDSVVDIKQEYREIEIEDRSSEEESDDE